MAVLCDAHLEQVLPQIPPICAVGPVKVGRGELGIGAPACAEFDFSWQGNRNQVIGVLGFFSRLPITQRLP